MYLKNTTSLLLSRKGLVGGGEKRVNTDGGTEWYKFSLFTVEHRVIPACKRRRKMGFGFWGEGNSRGTSSLFLFFLLCDSINDSIERYIHTHGAVESGFGQGENARTENGFVRDDRSTILLVPMDFCGMSRPYISTMSPSVRMARKRESRRKTR